ncbi:MAG TPA: MmgE/PrpD family protein [Bryobacteraceae bacterium]|nr:MmgE/PrpD family protein [Bryobacteraceae bacterium]
MTQLRAGDGAALAAWAGLTPVSLTTGVYRNRVSYTLMEELSLSRRMVRAASALTFHQLPQDAIAKVQIGLLDFLSCAFEARNLPWGCQAIRMASSATGNATVIGTSLRSSPAEAAFANATLGHGLVREDMHAAAVSHLGVVIYPTLLALAQQQKVSGRDFILSAVAGYEIGAAVGRAIMDQELIRRFRPTGITGPLGGAMAGSRFLKLNEDASVSALGFAANSTGGLNEWPYCGGDEMFFHPGFAARNAITAVQLASLGARASETALDGRAGLFAGLNKADCIGRVRPFSGPFEILSVYYKPAPACNYAQTPSQAALSVAMREGFQSAGVESVVVKAPEAAIRYPGCDYAGPFERTLQAKMSIQYCVAAALARGVIEESNYRSLDDPEINRLASITKLEIDPDLTAAYPAAQGVELLVKSGRGIERCAMRDVIAATPDQIRARFRRACANWRAVEEIIERIEEQEDMSVLSGGLAG